MTLKKHKLDHITFLLKHSQFSHYRCSQVYISYLNFQQPYCQWQKKRLHKGHNMTIVSGNPPTLGSQIDRNWQNYPWLFHKTCAAFFYLSFIEGQMLSRILLFSVKPQHESAIGIHMSPPFWTSLPSPSPSHPSRLIQSPCFSVLNHTGNSLWLSILHVVM